jgi:hypothetical protein
VVNMYFRGPPSGVRIPEVLGESVALLGPRRD